MRDGSGCCEGHLPTSAFSQPQAGQCNPPFLHLHTCTVCTLHPSFFSRAVLLSRGSLLQVPCRSNIVRLQGRGRAGDQEAKNGRQGREPWKGRQAQGTAPSQPVPVHALDPSQYNCRSLTPVLGKHAGAADAVSGQPLASRVHRPGSRSCPEPAHTGTGPVVLRIGIHHVAPSLVLPASLSSPPPSLLKYHHPSHPSRGSFPVFWCELESWKWSSPLDRIKVEHRDEEGRYLAGVLGTTEFFCALPILIIL